MKAMSEETVVTASEEQLFKWSKEVTLLESELEEATRAMELERKRFARGRNFESVTAVIVARKPYIEAVERLSRLYALLADARTLRDSWCLTWDTERAVTRVVG